jgi:hypothetical protein
VASQLGDYLKACGVTGRVSGNPQELADAAEQTAGQVYEAVLDWRLYAKGANADGTDLIIDGMENFPKDEQGNYVPFINHPTMTNEDGSPKRLWANLTINRFIPRS